MIHEITDNRQCPVRFCITAGQVSGYTIAAALMNGLPEADLLLAPLIYNRFNLPGSGRHNVLNLDIPQFKLTNSKGLSTN